MSNVSVLDEFVCGGIIPEEDRYKGVLKFLLPEGVEWFLPKSFLGKPSDEDRRMGKPMRDVYYRPTSWDQSGVQESMFYYNVHQVPWDSGLRPTNIMCGSSFEDGKLCGWCAKKIELEQAKWHKPYLFKHRERLITTGFFLVNDKWSFKVADWNTYAKNSVTYRNYLNKMATDSNKLTRINPKEYAGYGDGAKVFCLNYTWMGATREKESWNLTGMSVSGLDATLTTDQENLAKSHNPRAWLNPLSVDSVDVNAVLAFFDNEIPTIGGDTTKQTTAQSCVELEVMGHRELALFVMNDQITNGKSSKFADLDVRDYDASNTEELRRTIDMLMKN